MDRRSAGSMGSNAPPQTAISCLFSLQIVCSHVQNTQYVLAALGVGKATLGDSTILTVHPAWINSGRCVGSFPLQKGDAKNTPANIKTLLN